MTKNVKKDILQILKKISSKFVHLDPDPATQIIADPDPDPKPLCNEQERREYQLAVPYYRMSQLPPLAVLERLELSAPPLNPGSRFLFHPPSVYFRFRRYFTVVDVPLSEWISLFSLTIRVGS
jgi:hypothetical protein